MPVAGQLDVVDRAEGRRPNGGAGGRRGPLAACPQLRRERGLATVGRNVGAEVEVAGQALVGGVLRLRRQEPRPGARGSSRRTRSRTVPFAFTVSEERIGSSRPAQSRATRRRMSATQWCVCWLVRIRVLDKTRAPSSLVVTSAW